jgi:hypothetical protein
MESPLRAGRKKNVKKRYSRFYIQGGAMLPCCSRVRGLDDKDKGDAFFAPESMPLRGELSALRMAHDLERDFGPNEGGGGAFLKLRGKLAESRQGALGQRSNNLSPGSAPGQSLPGAPGAGTSPTGNAGMWGASPPVQRGQLHAGTDAPAESPQGFGSIGSSISSLGSFVSIGNSISSLGSNLGVPLNPPAQTTPMTRTSSHTGILKSGAESPRKTAGFGEDTPRSSMSTRPLSYRESARRCGDFYSSLLSPAHLCTLALPFTWALVESVVVMYVHGLSLNVTPQRPLTVFTRNPAPSAFWSPEAAAFRPSHRGDLAEEVPELGPTSPPSRASCQTARSNK